MKTNAYDDDDNYEGQHDHYSSNGTPHSVCNTTGYM